MEYTTEQVLEDFFPQALAALQARAPGWAQPSQCDVVHAHLGPLHLRSPSMLPLSLACAALGLHGAATLKAPGEALLRWSFLYFGCMALASMFAHTMLQRGTPGWSVALVLDSGCTGASALCYIFSQLLPRRAAVQPSAGLARQQGRRQAKRDAALGIVVGVICVAVAAAGHTLRRAWLLEMCYAGASVTACVVGAAANRRRLATGRARAVQAPLALALCGACLLVASPLLDRALCALCGRHFGTMHLAFLGSFMAMAGLMQLAKAEHSAGGRHQRVE